MSLPRYIPESAFPHIEEEGIKAEEVATKAGGKSWAAYDADRIDQRLFLVAFEKTFSVTNSLRAVDVSYGTYQRWRYTSIYFVKTFNGSIELWHDDIYVSAAVRARGHRMADEETDSGFKEDAEGNPLYLNADTQLTKMFLKATHPESFNDNMDVKLDHKSSDGTMTPPPALTETQQRQLNRVLDEEF